MVLGCSRVKRRAAPGKVLFKYLFCNRSQGGAQLAFWPQGNASENFGLGDRTGVHGFDFILCKPTKHRCCWMCISASTPTWLAWSLANRNARIVWALLAHKRDYEPKYGIDERLSTAEACSDGVGCSGEARQSVN